MYNQVREGKFVLTLGGDRIDAHADVNTPETSLSGMIHGMPITFVSGLITLREKGIFDWIEENDHHKFAKVCIYCLWNISAMRHRYTFHLILIS